VYLDDLQKQILGAREKLIREEKEFLHQLLEQLKECISALAQLCEHIARCDLYTGQAHQAMQKRYCKPQLTKESVLQITGARHPVIEEHLPTHEQFISNDLEIGITTRRGGHEQ
jgi:DNA mismatch repair protein MutS